MGLITDEVIALKSGRAALVVERVQDREPSSVVPLVPADALDRSRRDGVVIETASEERPVA